MIFLYIVNYAHQTEQGAFMAINTFLRDIEILKKEGGIVPSDKMVNYLLNIFNQLN